MRWIIRAGVASLLLGLPATLAAQQNRPSELRIIVVSGEDAVNIIQQNTAVAPVVEVRDRNNQPVAGALVTFTIQGGGNASFAGAGTITATTNALGQATAAGLTPTAAGAVNINVAAAFQGHTASALITQTNFATAAQAAAAGGSASGASTGSGAGGGGGGIGAGTVTAIGGAVAGAVGGLYAYREYQKGEAPGMTPFSFFPAVGLAAITPIRTNSGEITWHGDGARISIDWGDGATTVIPMPPGPDTMQQEQHVYRAAGTYTVRKTITDAWDRSASFTASITIKDLAGRWNIGTTGSYFTLTQSGATLGGALTSTNAQSCGNLSGTVREQSPNNVTFSVTAVCPEFNSSFTGTTVLDNPDVINGSLTMSGRTTTVQLVRQ